ncbi:ATP-binding protein (plasmid) [Cytobacillus spongiae]|uniref:ATP-binding protein n=1 Tax=Cytobacillus spongiae TaxID=2901381 RepID=UPI00145FC702|nr:ATP-binding protein [Cytobacillus spongiae]MCA1062555.1 two-component sensor histidine kinase [Rossellomorea aquimaris]NMH71001.1 two-component sensor histidine kinase [Bacillus sp. RO3]UII58198.1 ATP-binding protein [Cytobacillus spongiae]WJV28764.1 ATP-binding protein [Rossellomorea sp. AcN35-11]
MITLIKTLLVNITILFSFTYNANVFFPFKEKQVPHLKHKITYGLIGSFGALLCMLYPMETLGETHFDLRMIAILIATIYAGFLSGSIVLGCVILTRYLIGGPFVMIGIIVSALAFVMGVLFRKMLLKTQYKFLGSTFIFLIHSILYITIIKITIPFLDVTFYLIYFSVFYFTFVALVFIIEHLIRTNKQIEEMVYLDKLNMVGQMAASIAHEIRNPLATVRGFIQHLSENTDDEKFKGYSPLILNELDRTNKIITDYLSVAKPSEFHLSILHLEEVIQDCVDLLRPFASYTNTSILFQDSGTHYIKGDEHHMKQAIMNVMKNGIESIEEQGYIKISVKEEPSSESILLKITDTGKGMTSDELKKIGLPFYTTKTKGTGLGSMVTNKIIREMDGMIEYESQLDKGTTVTIRLPIVNENVQSPKA